MTQQTFFDHITHIASTIRSLEPGRVILFHHNDADGLTSGSILYRMFERLGWDIRRYCLEKPYPEILQFLQEQLVQSDDLVVFADFASGIADSIAELFQPIRMGLIVDHHRIVDSWSPAPPWYMINPLSFGIAGHTECSASSVSYLLSRTLTEENTDCAVTAVLGAIGDRHLVDEALVGINHDIYVEARSRGDAFREDTYRLTGAPGFTMEEIADGLDMLGSIAYLQGGPDIALKALAEGPGNDERHFVRQYEKAYEQAYVRLRSSNSLHTESPQLQWFTLDESWSSMGVKTVGLLCERLVRDGLVQPDAYLMGFQRIPDQIPGVGPFRFHQYKVSFRVGTSLRERIDRHDAVPLTTILAALGSLRGYFVDACHPHAAALTIPFDDQKQFIKDCQKVLQEVSGSSSQ